MDPSSAQHHHHHQEMSSQTLESMLVCTKGQQDKKPRPAEQALKCPRCDSTNTKFCYYNNYSLTQPRYFCKSCRRYWTKGGTLRNVPVGGGCRKNRRSSSSSSSTSSSSKRGQDHPHPISLVTTNNPNPLTNLSYDSDISLAIARLQKHSNGQMGFDHHDVMLGNNPNHHHNNNPHCDILGSHGHHAAANSPGFLGFLENHNGFQNLYYNGNNNSSIGHLENGLGHEEMSMVPYEETSVKQEMCNGRDHQGESGRVLWGFPWQVGGQGNNNMNMVGDLDSGSGAGRQSGWNNGFGSSWHGLLNSAPLM